MSTHTHALTRVLTRTKKVPDDHPLEKGGPPDESFVREMIKMATECAVANARIAKMPPMHYYSMDDMLGKIGVFSLASEFDGPPGEMGKCFRTAYLYAEANPGMDYCEGIAYGGAIAFPIHHAWIRTPDGRTVDPTWPWSTASKALYCGVAFNLAYVRLSLLKTKHYGLLCGASRAGYEHLHEIMEHGFPKLALAPPRDQSILRGAGKAL